MKPTQSFNSYIENSIKDNWDRDALTDYKGATLQYHDVARKIAKLHILFRHSGLQPGDKVALCGRNSSAWAAAFLATITYGAVAVPIQHEFTPDMVYNIVNHSESRLLFVGDVVSPTIDAGEMPALEGIIYIPDFSLTMSRSETLTFAREHLNKLFGEEYPKAFERSHVSYHQDSPEELALINYTSGTTGFSKGVMLPYRALWSNLDFTMRSLGANMAPGSNVLCTLPMAHMYGMMVEFFLNFCLGNHLFFLTRLPSPSLIQYALLLQMMAQVTGLQPGEFVHTTGDTHLYLNHLEQARLQLSRTPRPLPTMRINPDVKSIFDFRYEDFELENYDPWPHIAAEVSV